MARAVRCRLILVAIAAGGGLGFREDVARAVPPTDAVGKPAWGQGGSAPLTLPTSFIENRGQWPAAVRFATPPGGLRAIVEERALVLDLRAGEDGETESRAVLRLRFADGSSAARVEGEGRTAASYGFFRGKDPAGWKSGVGSWSSVIYRCLQDGIDVRVRPGRGEGRPIEYDLLLAPGADLDGYVVRCEGAELHLDDDGSLLLIGPFGTVAQAPPETWAELPDGARRPLACRYRLLDARSFAFVLEDPGLPAPVVIDPQLTFLGGGGDDGGYALRVGPDGSIFAAGENGSFDVPYPPDQPGVVYAGSQDAFVARFDSMLRELLWVADLGSPGTDRAADIDVDSEGIVTVVGYASADGFPVTADAVGAEYQGGRDGFLVRLDPDPSLPPEDQILYATLIGGSGDDTATGVAIAPDGHVCVVGSTSSTDFPTVEGSFDVDFNGGISDAFLCWILPDQDASPEEQLRYSTYLGGSLDECHPATDNIYIHLWSPKVDIDASGDALVTGMTSSFDFPTTPGAVAESGNGDFDAFVSRIRPDASLEPEGQLLASTLLGGSGVDKAVWVAPEASGNIVVGGWTRSADFPVTRAPLGAGGEADAFVARLSPALDQVAYSVRVGGSGDELTVDGCLDPDGAFAFCGCTFSYNFPVTQDAFQSVRKGNRDAFVAKVAPSLDPESQLVASTLLGGSTNDGWDEAWGMDFAAAGVPVVTGYTFATDFVDGGDEDAYDRTYGGVSDFFVARLDLRVPTAAFSMEPSEGSAPLTVQVDASASRTPEGTGDLTYSWDFGDGAVGQGMTTSHPFPVAGRFVVTLTVTNQVGLSSRATRTATVACGDGGDLAPWTAAAVGSPVFPGSARKEGDELVLCTGGHGFGGAADDVHFVHREVSGDFTLTARVAEVVGGAAGAGAGLEAREGLDPSARHAAILIERSTTLRERLRYREVAGTTGLNRSGSVIEAPRWLRLERCGDLFVARGWADGAAWAEIDRQTIAGVPATLLVGIAANGRDTGNETRAYTSLRARLSGLDLVAVQTGFVRGEANRDGRVDLSDAVAILSYLFLGGSLDCLDAGDVDDDGGVVITDAIALLNHLFLGGPEPAEPYPESGPDPTDDALGCAAGSGCG